MQTTSLRRFSRDVKLRLKMARERQQMILTNREKGGTNIEFLIIPFSQVRESKHQPPEPKKTVESFIGCCKKEVKKLTPAQQKEEIRKAWARRNE